MNWITALNKAALTLSLLLITSTTGVKADNIKDIVDQMQLSERLIASAIATSDTEELQTQAQAMRAVQERIFGSPLRYSHAACLDAAADLTVIAAYGFRPRYAQEHLMAVERRERFPTDMTKCEGQLDLKPAPRPNLRD